MKILIAGCGNVGYTLAETLNREGHEITVIESDEAKVERLKTLLDVALVTGNCASYGILKEAGVSSCDVLIAATGKDEINMLCCLIARRTAKPGLRTIARIRNPDYTGEIGFLKEGLGLALVINPEESAAEACFRLIQAPGAIDVDSVANGRFRLVTVNLPKDSPWAGLNLIEIHKNCKAPLLVAMVEREEKAFIPNGSFVLQAGDRVVIALRSEEISTVFRAVGLEEKRIRRVMIGGCGNVGYYFARRLLRNHYQVTVIDPSYERCRELNTLLPDAEVICGDYHSEQLLQEEGIAEADAVAALSGEDSENILLSLYAHKVSNALRITCINQVTMGGVLSEIPIGAVVSPKGLTAERILRYARAISGDETDSRMDAMYLMAEGRVEALTFTVLPDSQLIGRTLRELPLKPGVLLVAIVRDGKGRIPSGMDTVESGDQVVVMTEHRGTRKLRDLLS